jgi:hypothetical protein
MSTVAIGKWPVYVDSSRPECATNGHSPLEWRRLSPSCSGRCLTMRIMASGIAALRRTPMVTISISSAAYEAIKATLSGTSRATELIE